MKSSQLSPDPATEASGPPDRRDVLRGRLDVEDVTSVSVGAVNALAFVARHPEQVRVLVAHEPPAAQVLSDREHALSAVAHICQVYQEEGFGAGMARVHRGHRAPR